MPNVKRMREAQIIYEVGDAGSQESVAVLPITHLELRLTAQLTFADDRWSAYCPELDLATASDTQESAIRDLAQLAIEYAAEYLADFDLYVNSANRSAHLPSILTIARYSTNPEDSAAVESVRHLFDVSQDWVE